MKKFQKTSVLIKVQLDYSKLYLMVHNNCKNYYLLKLNSNLCFFVRLLCDIFAYCYFDFNDLSL